jgi:hypothetical protein
MIRHSRIGPAAPLMCHMRPSGSSWAQYHELGACVVCTNQSISPNLQSSPHHPVQQVRPPGQVALAAATVVGGTHMALHTLQCRVEWCNGPRGGPAKGDCVVIWPISHTQQATVCTVWLIRGYECVIVSGGVSGSASGATLPRPAAALFQSPLNTRPSVPLAPASAGSW